MIFTSSDRQGFNKSLSGVEGTSIQSAFTKPLIEPSLSFANFSWLPYPYGPLPDKGPWIDKEDNYSKENPTPDGQTPGTEGTPWKGETPTGNILMFLAVVGAALFLTSKTKLLR